MAHVFLAMKNRLSKTMDQTRGENKRPGDDDDDSPLQAAMRMADLIRKNITQAEEEQKLHQRSDSSSSIKNTEELSFRFPGPPGLVEGFATGLVVLGVLTPVRSLLVKRFLSPSRGGSSSSSVFKQQQDSLGFLPEFILTTTQMLLSAHAALYVGSLFGSHYYLHQLAAISNNDPTRAAVSRTADTICHDPLVMRLMHCQDQGKLILPSPVMPTTSSSVPSNTNLNVVSSSSSSSSSTMMMMMNPNQRVLLELQKALDTCRARNSLQQHENRT